MALSPNPTSARLAASRKRESGYVLLTLLLMLALMSIAVLVAIVPIQFANQRDQEEEMIHRGVQYSRAIRTYYKKFSRYPSKLEDLDHTNNLRFLRRHYKDPLNKNKDFRLLHYGEQGVQLGLGTIGGGAIPGATSVNAMNGPNGTNSAFGGNSSLGGSSFGGGNSAFGNSPVNNNGVFSQSSPTANPGSAGTSTNAAPATGDVSDRTATAPGDATDANTQVNANGASDKGSSNQLVSGGAIVGVASISKQSTIRVFNKKKKYNEWQFVYDPSTDRGGIITTPYQPALASFGNNNINGAGGVNGAQGSNGLVNQSPFGQNPGQSGFGQSSFGQSSFGQSSSGQSGFGQSNGNNNSNFGNSPQPQQPPSNQQ